MDQGAPYRRRQARAVTISAALEARRQAIFKRVTLALAAVVVVAEGVSIAHALWLAHA